MLLDYVRAEEKNSSRQQCIAVICNKDLTRFPLIVYVVRLKPQVNPIFKARSHAANAEVHKRQQISTIQAVSCLKS